MFDLKLVMMSQSIEDAAPAPVALIDEPKMCCSSDWLISEFRFAHFAVSRSGLEMLSSI